MDMRKEAENRVRRKQQEKERQELEIQRHRNSLKKSPMKPVVDAENKDGNNLTPQAAKLAAVDFQLNGSRARSEEGEFIMPRWIPDEESNLCQKCNAEFDMVNRKHHCRHCGLLVCQECSKYIMMLPHHFGFRDPQRVCNDCNALLLPLQANLSTNIANHHRVNNIEMVDGNCSVRRYFNFPISLTLGSEIRKAAYSTYNLFSLQFLKDKAIPLRLLEQAKGIAFLTVAKGGFVFAPRLGTGLVISKLVTVSGEHLWSAPCAIATGGLGVGFMVGFDVTDYVVILNTDEAVKAFSGVFQATLGVELEVAVGPVGRSGSAEMHLSQRGIAPAYSYSHSRGLFVGASLDGTVILTRNDVNHKFYGRPVSSEEILSGKVPPPRAAAALYQALSDAVSNTPFVTHAATPRKPASWSSATVPSSAGAVSVGAVQGGNDGFPMSSSSSSTSSARITSQITPVSIHRMPSGGSAASANPGGGGRPSLVAGVSGSGSSLMEEFETIEVSDAVQSSSSAGHGSILSVARQPGMPADSDAEYDYVEFFDQTTGSSIGGTVRDSSTGSGDRVWEPTYEVLHSQGRWSNGSLSPGIMVRPAGAAVGTSASTTPNTARAKEPIVLPLLPFLTPPAPPARTATSEQSSDKKKPVQLSPKNERSYEVPYEYGVRRDLQVESQIESEVEVGI